jgi:hypothetical protein
MIWFVSAVVNTWCRPWSAARMGERTARRLAVSGGSLSCLCSTEPNSRRLLWHWAEAECLQGNLICFWWGGGGVWFFVINWSSVSQCVCKKDGGWRKLCNEEGIHALCFEDGVMGGARCGMVAVVRNAYRFLALELRERNCLGDPG